MIKTCWWASYFKEELILHVATARLSLKYSLCTAVEKPNCQSEEEKETHIDPSVDWKIEEWS